MVVIYAGKEVIGMVYRIKNEICSRLRRCLCQDNSGMGVIEVILIIVVLISLVLIFKSQLTALVKTIFTNINNSALSV